MAYEQVIAQKINVQPRQVAATIELLDAGNTLPFIARYRKEVTGNLDEEQIRLLVENLENLRALDERRTTVLESIESQGKLVPELHKQILAAETRTELEDLYQPFKPRRRTRASIAREKGLEGLAQLILAQTLTNQTLEQVARPYLSSEVPSQDDALAGARDIVAEVISDHPQVRQSLREKALKWGMLRTEKISAAEDPRRVYETYYQFEGRVEILRPHQVLAIQRGEAEKVLRAVLLVSDRDTWGAIDAVFRPVRRSIFADQLKLAAEDSLARLLLPAIERDVRRSLQEQAEQHAIRVFADNLKALLLQPPLVGHTVLGLDPGYRTGCKVAIVDPTGKVLDTGTIYPHEPQNQKARSLDDLEKWVNQHGISLVSIGNGTASRETEALVAELIERCPGVRYVIANESGASVYSASPLARAELPNLDVSLRGAVSIARRIQDPLAELVKIDPKSIGVGLYQHDVDQPLLEKALTGVVESAVNRVGVDVNTASPALLTYVAGIGPKLAEKIVQYRDENGPFRNRQALKKVPTLGPKAFEQAAGFLRIRDGEHPFDASAIHPESYPAAERLLEMAGLNLKGNLAGRSAALESLQKHYSITHLAEALNIGVLTLMDILEQLIRPGRDPRLDLPVPILRSDVLKMEDLAPGMELKGTVRNVVDFGIFVDIGVKQDGLVHRSQIPGGTKLSVGDVITVEILKVEIDRGRIALRYCS
ncbi:MAG TPA: Tex family protein [Anaerolineaceae bacterium]|nr:Tex family protein [Anaerolineaceae bacterium]